MDPDLLSDASRENFSGTEFFSGFSSARFTLGNDSSFFGHFITSVADSSGPESSNQAGAIISKIERIFEAITDCILEEKKELSIKLKSRPRSLKENAISQINAQKGERKNGDRIITFPSKNPQEAWKFAALLRILELSHEALVTGVVTTKRDIYYREPELFMKQTVVDRYVDDIAYTFGVGREALNIVAAAKGLVLGAFTVVKSTGSSIDFGADPEGILVPNHRDIKEIHMLNVRWILIIEKEATFRTLASRGYWKDSLAGKGILITGKGYPDIQTRQFIYFLSQRYPFTPVYALMDSDPDGIGIMSTYKHGSINLAHESNLAVPSIKWLGVRSSDFLNIGSDAKGLLTLSARDHRIATKMLQRDTIREDGEVEWRRELQVMLMLNIKAEIQILGTGARLVEWLDEKLLQGY